MTFLIITHVPHILKEGVYFAYAPYVREMNIWSKFADKIIIVAPLEHTETSAIHIAYEHTNIEFLKVPGFDLLSLKSIIVTVFKLPKIGFQIFRGMKGASHIHLRCPGNIGLIGCIVQILFPNKQKTAKYAGNWDPESSQPWSYRLQKYILNNSFFTRNIKVLVYGEWEKTSINIKPFFTASYSESDKAPLTVKNLNQQINVLYAGGLVKGKNPLYAIQLVEALKKRGYNVVLNLFGEGQQRIVLENYISQNQLDTFITLQGNQHQENLILAFKDSHFVILPSESEGWPKAVAEGMFWGCVPLATPVSCVPFMLDYGKRGVLLEMNLEQDIIKTEGVLLDESDYQNKRNSAAQWSRKFTLNEFESEIEQLLKL